MVTDIKEFAKTAKPSVAVVGLGVLVVILQHGSQKKVSQAAGLLLQIRM
jgi:hypothetical protein